MVAAARVRPSQEFFTPRSAEDKARLTVVVLSKLLILLQHNAKIILRTDMDEGTSPPLPLAIIAAQRWALLRTGPACSAKVWSSTARSDILQRVFWAGVSAAATPRSQAEAVRMAEAVEASSHRRST